MKITSFNCTIELSKDENGYSNNCYVSVDEGGVSISSPYIKMTPEETIFTTDLIRDFVGMSMNYNARTDSFNRDMGLEQYAPQVAITEETSVPQEVRGGSDSTDLVAHSEQEQERLDMEELEVEETGSDKA